jgi:hypothetical protein
MGCAMKIVRTGKHGEQKVAELEDGRIVPIARMGLHKGQRVAELEDGTVAFMPKKEKGGINWTELAIEGGLMTAGGALLSPLGPGGIAVGGGLGYAAAQELLGKQETLGQIPPMEYAQDLAKNVVLGIGYEAVGGAATKVAGKALAPAAKAITPRLKGAAKVFAEKGRELMPEHIGTELTPAQATETRILDVIENVVEHSLFGGGRYRKFREGQAKLITRIADDIATKMGPDATDHEIGQLVQDTLRKEADSFYSAARIMYSRVDELARGLKISTKELKKEAAKLQQTVGVTDKPTQALLKQITSMNNEVPFKQLQQMRSDLLSMGYRKVEGELVPGRTARFARKFAGRITDIFESPEKGLTPIARESLKRANKFFAEGKQEFSYKLLRSLTLNEPEKVMRRVFAKGAIEPIRRIKKIVGPEAFSKMRGHHARKLLFEDAWDVGQEKIVGTRLEGAMKRLGKDTMKEIYGANYMKEWNKFLNTVKAVQRKPPALGGGMLVQLTQAGAIISLVSFDIPKGGAGVILLGPAAMAQLLTRPASIRWLTRGITMPATAKGATRIATRLAALSGEQLFGKDETEFPVGP